MRRSIPVTLVTWMTFLVAGCPSGDDIPADAGDADVEARDDGLADVEADGPPAVRQVIVQPANAVVNAGDIATFTARAVYDDGTDREVAREAAWTSDDRTIATVEGGVVTGVSMGATTITATYLGLSSNSATVVVVVGDGWEDLQVIPAEATLSVGGTLSFRAIGLWSDGMTADVTEDVDWNSSDTGVAVMDPVGVATGTAPGETTISAEIDGTTGEATLTVVEDAPVVLFAITLDPTAATLLVGCSDSLAMSAKGLYSDGTTVDLTATAAWISSDPTVATVDAAGIVEAALSAAGTTEVTAAYEGVTSAPAVITVEPCPTVVVSIAVLPAVATLCPPMTQPYRAEATFLDGHTEDVTARATWSSSDPSVATIDSAGVATALMSGTTTIVAELGTVTGTAVLVASNSDPVSVTLDPDLPTIRVGETLWFGATISWTCGEVLPCPGWWCSWTSSDPAVATIGSDAGAEGLARALTPGTTTITVTSAIGLGDRDDSTVLTVVP